MSRSTLSILLPPYVVAWSIVLTIPPCLAGDYCHKRRIKCRPSDREPDRCQNCVDFDLACVYERPLRRGRTLAGQSVSRLGLSRSSQVWPGHHQQPSTADHSSLPSTNNDVPRPTPAAIPPVQSRRGSFGGVWNGADNTLSLGRGWKSFARASTPLLAPVLSVYFETVYPMLVIVTLSVNPFILLNPNSGF